MYQPFQLLFYKGNSLIGILIRKVSHSRYSHVTLILDYLHTLETSWNNPSVIKHFNYKYKSYDVYELNVQLTQYQKQIVLQYITEHILTGYDWIYLLTRGFNILFGTKIINSKKYLTCDELTYEAFKKIGINLIQEDEMLSPESLSRSKYLTKLTE